MEVLLNGDPWKMLEGVAVVLLRIRQGPSFVLRESSFIQAGKKNLSKRRVLKDKKEVVWMGAAAETGLSHPKCLCALLLQLSSGEISLSSSSVSSSSTVCMANKRD